MANERFENCLPWARQFIADHEELRAPFTPEEKARLAVLLTPDNDDPEISEETTRTDDHTQGGRPAGRPPATGD